MSWTSGTATDYWDYVERLDTFLNIGHNLRPAYNTLGTGLLYYILGTATSVQETITVTFTSSTTFDVSGSVSGSLGSGVASASAPFTSSVVSFYVVLPNGYMTDTPGGSSLPTGWVSGSTGWTTGDSVVFVMTPPWQTVYKKMFRAVSYIGNMTSASLAFDKNNSSYAYRSSFPATVGVQMLKPKAVRRFIIGTYSTHIPTAFSLEYSDDNVTWTVVQSYTDQLIAASSYAFYDLGTTTAPHIYWRLNITASTTASVYIGSLLLIDEDVPADRYYSDDFGSRTYAEIVWKAPGDNGTSQIYVGLKESHDVPNDAYCWQTYGAANYDPELSNGYPNSQLRAFYGDGIALRNGTVRYWFMASGSYINQCANISTVYMPSMMGLINLYSNAERYTYPLGLAACLRAQVIPSRFSLTGDGMHQGFWCAAIYNSVAPGLSLMLNDGTVSRFYGDGYASMMLHPGRHMQQLNKNSNGTVPMFPIVVFSYMSRYCAGQLGGMQQISGDGILSEDIITVGKTAYIVFQGVYETSKTTYVAYELL